MSLLPRGIKGQGARFTTAPPAGLTMPRDMLGPEHLRGSQREAEARETDRPHGPLAQQAIHMGPFA